MGKDPAYLFYPADASEDTQFMNRLERGAYFDILKAQKKFGKFKLEHIRKILGTDFNSCWPALEICLTCEDDMYFIGWVNDSIVKRKEYTESRRKNRTGKPKNPTSGNIESYVQDMTEAENTYVSDMVIENEIEIEGIVEKKQCEKYVIPTMMAKFKELKPKYIVQKEKDYPALLKIASIISRQQAVSINDGNVITIWEQISKFIISHKLYKDFALFQVERYFQAITSEFVSVQEHGSVEPRGKSTLKNNATAASDAMDILAKKFGG